MSPRSIREYVAALPSLLSARVEGHKSRLLREFCQLTGFHRKSAIRRLERDPEIAASSRGRPRQYGLDLVPPLRTLWEASAPSARNA